VTLLDEAKTKGVRFLQGSASSLSLASGRVMEIDVAFGDETTLTLPCDNLVIAAGPWSGLLSELLPIPIPITSHAGHSVLLHTSPSVGADCIFMSLNTQVSSYPQILPRRSGEVYIAGVNTSFVLPATPEDATPQKAEIDKLKEIADTVLLDYTIGKEQLCFRPMTKSGKPYICPFPGVNGVYVGTGHSYFGITLGPGTGKILSEMVLCEELSIDVSQFTLQN
jgi:glycine/D-amino acid oxidase-like deaminating enzyme